MGSDAFVATLAAVEAHDLEAVRAALAVRPDVLEDADDQGRTLLSAAVACLVQGDWSRPPAPAADPERQRLGIVERLLAAGADVTTSYGEGWTPLHGAAYAGHPEAVQLLLDRGAPLDACAYADGGTPLMQALFWGHRDTAELLAAAGGPIENLRCAAGLGDARSMASFVAGDGELRPQAGAHRGYYRPHEGFPAWEPSDDRKEILDEALSYAARSGRVHALAFLVDHGADVDAAPYGGGALHHAANFGRYDAVRWLLDHGADVNSRAGLTSQGGASPLHTAAWAEDLQMVELLVSRGADPAQRDDEHGSTPYGYASFRGAQDVVRFLQQFEPDA